MTYGDRSPKLSVGVLDVWYCCLSDLDAKGLETAALNYIKANKYPSTVAELREKYREVPVSSASDRFALLDGDVQLRLKETGNIYTANQSIDLANATKEQIKQLKEAGVL